MKKPLIDAMTIDGMSSVATMLNPWRRLIIFRYLKRCPITLSVLSVVVIFCCSSSLLLLPVYLSYGKISLTKMADILVHFAVVAYFAVCLTSVLSVCAIVSGFLLLFSRLLARRRILIRIFRFHVSVCSHYYDSGDINPLKRTPVQRPSP